VLEGLRARLERLLAEHTPAEDPRSRVSALHAGLLEMKVAVSSLRDGLAAAERSLSVERGQLADAERRGALAAGIPDEETMRVAEQFANRHRERIGVLEAKVSAQRAELELGERDLAQLTAEWRAAKVGTGTGRTAAQEAAWRDIESAGGVRPETDVDGEILKQQITQAQMDAAVAAQLEHLKRKMGRKGEPG
jgi:hypothetical protein